MTPALDIPLIRDILQLVAIVTYAAFQVGKLLTPQITAPQPRSRAVEVRILERRRAHALVYGVYGVFMCPFSVASLLFVEFGMNGFLLPGLCGGASLLIGGYFLCSSHDMLAQAARDRTLLVQARAWAAGRGDYQPQ